MKEAAGEANMTVITIVLIAIVLGVGTLIVNSMMNSSKNSTACTSCGGYWEGGKCYEKKGSSTTIDYKACLDVKEETAGASTGSGS